MAVTSVIEKPDGLGGGIAGKSVLTAKKTYSATYQVKCDSQSDTTTTIINHFRRTNGLPFIGDAYDFGGDRDSDARCKGLSPSLIDKSGGIWLVRAEFEPLDNDDDEQKDGAPRNGESEKQTNPLLWHDEIDVGYTQLSIPVEMAEFRGIHGIGANVRFLPVGKMTIPVNSALQPFDPGLEQEIDIKVVRITKNVQTFNANTANFYIGTVNSDQVIINKQAYGFLDLWRPLYARIKAINASFQIANQIPYWKQTIEVHVSQLTWRKIVCDRGLDRRAAPGDILERDEFGNPILISPSDVAPNIAHTMAIKGPDGLPVTTPCLLDGDGQPLEPGRPAVWLNYRVYRERAFAGIRW